MLKMIELPYPLNALEPYYSTQTLELHYKILYKRYVDNTNKTQEELKKAREQIIKDFGSYDAFKNQFTEASKVVEASRMVHFSMDSKVE